MAEDLSFGGKGGHVDQDPGAEFDFGECCLVLPEGELFVGAGREVIIGGLGEAALDVSLIVPQAYL